MAQEGTLSPRTHPRRPTLRQIGLALTLLAGFGGCSLQRMAVEQTAAILQKGIPAIEREWDYDLAAETLPSNVKVVESFLNAAKGNQILLTLAAKGYTSLGLVVLEDQLEQLEPDTPPADKITSRAKAMYMRAHRLGLRLLDVRIHRFTRAYKAGREQLAAALAGCEKGDVPGLIWTALPLASAINLGRDDVSLIAKLPKAKALVVRAIELDEGYYYAAGHMVLGAMYGGVGKMLGGDPVKSKQHFTRALELTKRRFLMIQVMYAKTLAVQLQDKQLFSSLLREVLDAKLDIFPEQKLANVVAKRKARRLLKKIDELF